jgi:hypothetical protein
LQGPQARLPELHTKRYLSLGPVVQNFEFRALLTESSAESLQLRIDGGFGEDILFGGPGNDTILAADGQVDQVNCGLGENDTAYVDEKDDVDPAQATICENLFVARPE